MTDMTQLRSIISTSVCRVKKVLLAAAILSLPACAGPTDVFHESTMDFGSIRTVVVLPIANLSRDTLGSDRTRDVFVTALMATGGIYVIPTGEVARGIVSAGIANPTSPSTTVGIN